MRIAAISIIFFFATSAFAGTADDIAKESGIDLNAGPPLYRHAKSLILAEAAIDALVIHCGASPSHSDAFQMVLSRFPETKRTDLLTLYKTSLHSVFAQVRTEKPS